MKNTAVSKRNASNGPLSCSSLLKDFDDAVDIFSQGMDSWLSTLGISRFPGVKSASFVPAIDMVENEKDYSVRVELPGMNVDNVDVTISGDNLLISGEKKTSHSEENKNNGTYYYESSYGSFHREVQLPENIDKEHMEATMKDGVLNVIIQKKSLPPPKEEVRKLEVKSVD